MPYDDKTSEVYWKNQRLVAGQWFSLHPPVTPTNKTGRHDITEILLKVALNTITLTLTYWKDNQQNGHQ